MGSVADISKISISLVEQESEKWDDFIRANDSASVYHLFCWRKLITEQFAHPLYYFHAHNANGEIIGVLPLVRLKSLLFGDYMVSMPYFNFGGAIAANEDVKLALMEKAGELATELGVSHIEFRGTSPLKSDWPVREDKVSMLLQLPESEEVLWKRIGSKVRAQVKRPMRENVSVVRGGLDLLDEFYQVFSRNMRDLGTPVYPRSFFDAILTAFPENSFIHVVRFNDKPVAAGFLLGHKGRLEIPWASSLREHNRIGVNMALYWDVLKFAISSGHKIFDFGRSTKDCGTYRFKKQWGAEPQQLYWHYWLKDGGEMPKLTPDNPKYRAAIYVWQRLPLAIAEWLGPKIVKNLP